MRQGAFLNAALAAALLCPAWLPFGNAGSAQAQDPIWLIGDRLIDFRDVSTTGVGTAPLPTSNDPAIDDDYEYQGQVAQHAQNVQFDDNGNVLLFAVDGHVYNHDGLLIGDSRLDAGCEMCMAPGATQIAFIPVPGSCTEYYVVSSLVAIPADRSAFLTKAYLRIGIVDLLGYSTLSYYVDNSLSVRGRFVEQQDDAYVQYFDEGYANGELLPVQHDEENIWLWDMELNSSQGPFETDDDVVRFDVVDLEDDDRYLMAVNTLAGLTFVLFTDHGPDRLTPFFYSGSVGLAESDRIVRGEVAAQQSGSTLQLAYSHYIRTNVYSPNDHELGVVYWAFDLDGLDDPTPTIALAGGNDNPRRYRVEYYAASYTPAPEDGLGNVVDQPRVGGVAFSPNGRYIYFERSASISSPQSDLGYIDLQAVPPAQLVFSLEIPNSASIVDSEIHINVAPDGDGQALYLLGADGVGDYWLGALSDPDHPDADNWQAHVVDLSTIALHAGVGDVQYRLLNSHISANTHLGQLQGPVCCDAIALMNDRSMTVPSGTHTWTATSNPFGNTAGPIYIHDDLHFATGAHVQATGLEFRFAADATLTIAGGASFQCTSCIFTNACPGDRWKGIEIWGNGHRDQSISLHPTYQGQLDLDNSRIYNAEIGILVGKRLPNGSIGMSGGMVTTQGSKVANCREGVHFTPYRNFDPDHPTTERQNRSRFKTTTFTVDDAYPVGIDFQWHAYLWKVSGIVFNACTFANERSIYSDGYSHQLGQGIHSLDANFRVVCGCASIPQLGTPCPQNDVLPTLFSGLDHGIEAWDGATTRNFQVDHAFFENNVCGVYAEGVPGFVVVHSDFTIGRRGVVLDHPIENGWQGHHRGIYSFRSYGFQADYNFFKRDGQAEADADGIVIGYSGAHNDMVFHNTAQDMERAYRGEGTCISTDPLSSVHIGLQFLCNTNAGNRYDFTNRRFSGEQDADYHTIRTFQGDPSRPADNVFDRDAGGELDGDFTSNVTYGPLTYFSRAENTVYDPEYYTVGLVNPEYITAANSWAQNCAARTVRIPVPPLPHTPGPQQAVMQELETERDAYTNTKYLYDHLIDGGSTDELVEELTEGWSQDAWDLRDTLLMHSPYVSEETLRKSIDQGIMPAAMVTEVCVANPQATQKSGFLQWLRTESPTPLAPEMFDAIIASWDTLTFRGLIEGDMADHHGEMTQAVNYLVAAFQSDTLVEPLDSLLWTWQALRTPVARYTEALIDIHRQDFTAAEAVLDSMSVNNKVEGEQAEHDRMAELVDFLAAVYADERTEYELDSTEVVALEALVDSAYDLPAIWAQNILCFGYGRCRPPLTGEGEEKSLMLPGHATMAAVKEQALLALHPNPAQAWVALDYDLRATPMNAVAVVSDITGRERLRVPLRETKGQTILNTRQLPAGTYTVQLFNGGVRLDTEKLVVRP